MVKHAIILTAGKSLYLDGKNKVLIRHPLTRETIMDSLISAFSGKKITVVVGFGALQVMEDYPQLDYIINDRWATTNNAMSLGLALSKVTEPTYVVSGDMFFDRDLITAMDKGPANLVLTENRENRTLTSIHCELDEEGVVQETYLGPIRSAHHPETAGLFKVSDERLRDSWHKQSLRHGNLFIAQTLPCHQESVFKAFDLGRHYFREVNSIADYWRLIEEGRSA